MRQQLLQVWERSVLATHSFLSASDFDKIKKIVHRINFEQLPVYCAVSENSVLAFIGVEGKQIEMLFVDPDYFGCGIGKMLMTYAFDSLGANNVSVNEQNVGALAFYFASGFEVYDRQPVDGLGLPYPILNMKKM